MLSPDRIGSASLAATHQPILPTNGRVRISTDAYPMTTDIPHYLLFSEASRQECATARWRFVLQNVSTKQRFSAADVEQCDSGTERLELLAVVRGLEALDGPARVTLVTKSRYVCRGIKQGIQQWCESNWQWERFGRNVPVRDDDLWQRVARAMEFHQVDCQAWQFDADVEQSTADNCHLEEAICSRPHKPRSTRVRRRVASKRRVRSSRTVSGWVDRWADAIGSLSQPSGLSLGSAATR